MSVTYGFVSVADNFVHPQSTFHFGYHPFGEAAHIFYCLLQKIKRSSILPSVEHNGGNTRLSIIRNLLPLTKSNLLVGTQVPVAREKVGSFHLKKKFRRDSRKFLEGFLNCVLSTIATRYAIGQVLSCFCPPILICGDDLAPMQLLEMLHD